MCGISGVVSAQNVVGRLQSGIQNLEYRGYDSCGMAVINGNGTVVKKNIGYVAEVADKEMFSSLNGVVGIAHTRWATHGGVTQENAHPHLSCDGRIAIVHNGIISNYMKLKKILEGKKHVFKSETDSEVVAHLVEEHITNGRSVESAFLEALRELEGSYAIALVAADEPNKIFCAKHESPLIIGLGENENYVGSDFNAFIEHTKSSIILDDGEFAIVTNEGYSIKKSKNGEPVSKKVTIIEWDAEMAKKGGFPHFMLKEIHEQPDSIANVLAIEDGKIREIAKMAVEAKCTYLVGVGTTYYAALFGQYHFAELAGIMAPAVSSDEALESAPMNKGNLILAVSQSGETYDTLRVLRAAKKAGVKTAAVVNVIGSTMSRMVDVALMQGSGPEICVISTKVAIAQIVTLMRIAIEAGVLTKKITVAKKKEYLKQLATLPDLIGTFLNENSAFVRSLASRQANQNNWLFLGRGKYYPIALEAALKVKEVAYHHAEGMPAGFLKHGTIALIDDKIRTMVFLPPESDKELYGMIMSSIEELNARGGNVVGIHFSKSLQDSKLFADQLCLPKAHPFVAPIISLVFSQLYSYFVATTLGRNVDKPRALAKSVTVA